MTSDQAPVGLMRAHSMGSAAIGLGLLIISAGSFRAGSLTALLLFTLAMWQGIYAIWFWKGSALRAFAAASVAARLALGLLALGLAVMLQPDTELLQIFRGYVLLQAAFDLSLALCTGIWLWRHPGVNEPRAALSVEAANRLLFAAYMMALVLWMGLAPEGFLKFFHLPPVRQVGESLVLHLMTAQILLLAVYNLVAVYRGLQPLIQAGMRGGLFTCLFFIGLVLAGLLHPVTLLLPLADFVSAGVLILHRHPGRVTAVSGSSRR